MQKRKPKSGIVFLIIIVLLAAGGFLYIYIAKQKQPAVNTISQSSIDLRPLILAKLQQIVAKGSDSLYRLSIKELEPDVTASKVNAYQLSLLPDSAVLRRLDKEKKAPDDVLFITLDTLRITGINLLDFLHKKDVQLDGIIAFSPHVRIAHTKHPYNAAKRKEEDSLSLYQKLMQGMNSIEINTVAAHSGSLIFSDATKGGKTTTLSNLDAGLYKIRIDSTTQYDNSRFLFAKQATLSMRDYIYPTSDSMYICKAGSVMVSANDRSLMASDLSLEPRGGKEAFEKKLKWRDDMFTVHFAGLSAKEINWRAALNGLGLHAGEVTFSDGFIKDYLDRTLPSTSVAGRKDNYPQQMLKEVPFPVLVQKLTIQKLDVIYEEFNPTIKRAGAVTFNHINGTISNITNIAAQIKTNPVITCSAEGLFMNSAPLKASFHFDLSKLRTGAFSSQFHIATVPDKLINPISEPMGMYSVEGTADEATVSVTGDNFKSTTGITLLYHNLHIFPLKKTDDKGDMKKRKLESFFANKFIIKNDNPSGNKAPRHYDVPVQRDPKGGSFFNFLWQSILTGIVKTVGLPKKFADQ